jgi:hypothetical protein
MHIQGGVAICPKNLKLKFFLLLFNISSLYKSRDSILYLGVTVLVYRRYREEKDDSYSSEVNSKYFACVH